MCQFKSPGIALFWIAALAACAFAQTPPPGGNWENISRLSPGAEIRVILADGRSVRGFLQSTAADLLAINATTSQEMLVRQNVKRVQLKRPGHRGRNTLIGLGLGAAGGLVAGAGIDHSAKDSWFPNAGKVVLTPIGMIIGTVVGVALPTGGWHDVYRAR